MNVVWEVNGVTLIGLLVQCVVVAIYITRASDKAHGADKKADDALANIRDIRDRLPKLDAIDGLSRQALECANSCKEKITIMSGGFAAYRELVAQTYVTRSDMRDFEDRMDKGMEKLGTQIERAIDRRGPVHPAE